MIVIAGSALQKLCALSLLFSARSLPSHPCYPLHHPCIHPPLSLSLPPVPHPPLPYVPPCTGPTWCSWSPVSTTLATSLAASTPPPIATPTCAAARAAVSFTPSPTMATRRPEALSCSTTDALPGDRNKGGRCSEQRIWMPFRCCKMQLDSPSSFTTRMSRPVRSEHHAIRSEHQVAILTFGNVPCTDRVCTVATMAGTSIVRLKLC